jgi:hypothetical protein
MTGETSLLHSLSRSRRAKLAFAFAEVGRFAGDFPLLRAIISNSRYDGLIGSCGRTNKRSGAQRPIVLSAGGAA